MERIILEADDRASATRRAGRRGMDVARARVLNLNDGTVGWKHSASDVPLNTPPAPRAPQARSPDHMFCPNWSCKFVGVGRRGRGFSTTQFAALLLLGVVPGIVYAIRCRGETLTCPQCGAWVHAS